MCLIANLGGSCENCFELPVRGAMGQLFAVSVLAASTGDGTNTAGSLTWRSNIMRRIDAHLTINCKLHEICTANMWK